MNEFEASLRNYFSEEQLSKIQNTKIGIAGAGGLGSNIAACLVRSGFKDFEILDSDVIETKNLNRQYYFLDEVGLPKVIALSSRLRRINPDIKIAAGNVRIQKSNVSEYFQDRDIIFEAFDEVDSKKLLLEEFGNSGKTLIFGNGMSGVANKEIIIRKIKKNIYIIGDQETYVGKESPPLAPRVAACAATMAAVALENILTIE